MITRISEVYIDMDGVLVDFFGACLKLDFFKEKGITTADEVKPYLIEGSDRKDYSNYDNPAWSAIKGNKYFWRDADWMPDGKELWDYFNVEFRPIVLTSPVKTVDCFTGKMDWVRKHLGKDVPLIFKDSIKKSDFAWGGSLLIDDRSKCVDPWIENGGLAILHTSTEDTISEFESRECVRSYII